MDETVYSLGSNVSSSLQPGHVNKSCFVLGGEKQQKQSVFGLFPMNVNTSGHIGGDYGAGIHAGETLSEAESHIHARSFGGSTS